MGVVLLWIQFLQTAYSKTILPLAAREEFLSKPNRPFGLTITDIGEKTDTLLPSKKRKGDW